MSQHEHVPAEPAAERVLVDMEVDAPVGVVWAALRDPAEVRRWFGWDDVGLAAEIEEIFVERAQVDELFARPQHHYTSGLLAASPASGQYAGTDRLEEIPGLVPVLSTQPDSSTFAERCPAADAQCLGSAPALTSDHDMVALPPDHLVACWHPCGNPEVLPREASA